jgi:hypothetical protein
MASYKKVSVHNYPASTFNSLIEACRGLTPEAFVTEAKVGRDTDIYIRVVQGQKEKIEKIVDAFLDERERLPFQIGVVTALPATGLKKVL